MNKKLKTWLLIVLIVIAPFSFIILWLNYNLLSNEEWMIQYVEYTKSTSYDGVVVRKIYDSEPKKLKNVVLKNQGLDSLFIDFRIQLEVYKYIEIGDSLSKSRDNLFLKVYRNNNYDTTLYYDTSY